MRSRTLTRREMLKLGGTTALGALLAACAPAPTQAPAQAQPEATAAPTEAAAPAAAPVPQISPVGWIPGLLSGDITSNLVARYGMDCAGPDSGLGGLIGWSCDKGAPGVGTWLHVEFIGTNVNRIEAVDATVVSDSANDKLAVDFLAFVASLPYDSAEPDRAQQWVRTNIAKGGETRIGGILFTLFGKPGNRNLSISALD